ERAKVRRVIGRTPRPQQRAATVGHDQDVDGGEEEVTVVVGIAEVIEVDDRLRVHLVGARDGLYGVAGLYKHDHAGYGWDFEDVAAAHDIGLGQLFRVGPAQLVGADVELLGDGVDVLTLSHGLPGGRVLYRRVARDADRLNYRHDTARFPPATAPSLSDSQPL